MVKKRGLGKGLDILLGGSSNTQTAAQVTQSLNQVSDVPEQSHEKDRIHYIPIEAIKRSPFQPRRYFDEEALKGLSESIKMQGVLQPIIVRAIDNNQYELVIGERRWRAAQMAELTEIPSVIRELDNHSAAAIALIENIQRQDLRPLEEAGAIKRLLEEFSLTHEELGHILGRSRSWITNRTRLLDLGEKARALLEDGKIQEGHARAILSLEESIQTQLAQEIYAEGLSVRQTEKRVKMIELELKNEVASSLEDKKDKKSDIGSTLDHVNVERELTEKIGAKITIQHQKKSGKGKLIIDYSDLNQLQGILDFLQKY